MNKLQIIPFINVQGVIIMKDDGVNVELVLQFFLDALLQQNQFSQSQNRIRRSMKKNNQPSSKCLSLSKIQKVIYIEMELISGLIDNAFYVGKCSYEVQINCEKQTLSRRYQLVLWNPKLLKFNQQEQHSTIFSDYSISVIGI